MNINNEIIIRSTTGCHVVGCPIDLTTVSEQEADKIVQEAVKYYTSETDYKGKLVAFTVGNTYVVDTEEEEEVEQEDESVQTAAVKEVVKALVKQSNADLLAALEYVTYQSNQATRNAVGALIMDNEEALAVFMEVVGENPAPFIEMVTPYLTK